MLSNHNPFNASQSRLYSNLLSTLENESTLAATEESSFLTESTEDVTARQNRNEAARRERAHHATIRSEKRRAFLEKKRIEEETRVERRRAYVRELARRTKREVSLTLARERVARPRPFFLLRGDGTTIAPGSSSSEGIVTYVGERRVTDDGRGWTAHGKGRYVRGDGDVSYGGGFHEGRMHGYGVYRFGDGSLWNGRFVGDALDGIGSEVKSSSSGTARDVIFRNNRRVCFADELKVGVYCRFSEGTGAVVLGEGAKRGHYRVKFDDGCVKSVDLADRAFELCDKSHVRVVPIDNYCVDERDGPPTASTRAEYYRSYQEDNMFVKESEHAEDERDAASRLKKDAEMHRYGVLMDELRNEEAKGVVRSEVKKARAATKAAEEKHAQDALLFEQKLRNMREEREEKIRLEEEKIKKSREDAARLFATAEEVATI